MSARVRFNFVLFTEPISVKKKSKRVLTSRLSDDLILRSLGL